MFNFNLLTGPCFTAGILQGFNKRSSASFQPDPNAHYKIMGIGMGITAVASLNSYHKERPLVKSSLAAHLVGGGLIGGTLLTGGAYCLGLLLTKIPSKTEFD